jgi:hypothetical protein
MEPYTKKALKTLADRIKKTKVGSAQYEALMLELDSLIFEPVEEMEPSDSQAAEEWELDHRTP